ncbi:MAG: DUF4282 domain-containing protein [Nocardiaceae bacterium]|nr:DUF4282 domain-containing protein [Nocardiaceae bacterium]
MGTSPPRGQSDSAPLLSGPQSAPRVRNIAMGLADVKFRAAVTPQMIASIYVLFIGAVLMFCVSLAVERSEPGVKNIVGLVLIVPAIFIGAVVSARVVLEFVLTMFLLRDRVEEMRESIESVPRLADQMTELVDKIAVMADTISKVGDNMAGMAHQIEDLTDQMSSVTATIEKLDEQLPAIVENTTNIPAQIGGLPFDQLKRGWRTIRGKVPESDGDGR